MDWYKRNPFFYTVLAILVLVAVGGMWMLNVERMRLSDLTQDYERKSRVLEGFLSRRPAPTNGNVDALELNYATLYQEYKRALSALKLNAYDPDLFFGKLPPTHTDAFFDIARYVEDLRNLALSKGIVVPEEYRFGFQEYANVGPKQEDIKIRHRQMKIMKVLGQWLFDSGISELLGIQRGRETQADAVSRPAGSNTEFVSDTYTVNMQTWSLIDGSIEAKSFRVAFKGQSASLRSFLNRISNSSLPFVVSSIEARLANEEKDRASELMPENPFFQDASDEAIEASRIPIISDNESLFVVTLKFLELKEEFADPVLFAKSGGANDA